MSFNDRIDTLLTTLADDDSDAVERALQIYDVNDIVAVMAKRLLDAEAGGGGGSSPSVAFSLTAAQVKASTLTPHTLIPAQGANTLIVPTVWVFSYTPGGTPFSADEVDFVYGDNDLNVVYSGLGASPIVWYAFGTQSSGVSESGAATDMLNKAVNIAANLRGAIAETTLGNGGGGYAVGDTGTIDDGSSLATYIVTGIGVAGTVTGFTVTDGGDGYTLATGRAQTEWTTTPGGAQPGGGSGLVINVTAIDAADSDGDGTLSGVVYYLVADLS